MTEKKAPPKMLPLQFPLCIFKTHNRMDDYGAADMKNGDLTEAELKGKFNLRGVSVTLDPYTGEKTPTSFAMDHFNKNRKKKSIKQKSPEFYLMSFVTYPIRFHFRENIRVLCVR